MTVLMREIKLHVLKVGEEHNGKKVKDSIDYKAMLIQVLQRPKAGQQVGATTEESREVGPILDALDDPQNKEGDPVSFIEVTESQWADIKQRVANFTWPIIFRSTPLFEDDIKNAKIIEMTRKEVKEEPAEEAGP